AGLWTYAPNANANGSDSFTLTVFDGSGGSAAQTINLTVNAVNDTPAISSASSFNGSEDVALSSSVTASDVEGSSLSYGVSGNARASISGSTWTYAPAANFYGSDSFTLTVSDGAASVTQTITVHLAAVNDAPVVSGGSSGSGDEDSSLTGTLVVSDVDGMADGSYFTLATQAVSGIASIDPVNGAWTYAAAANFNGSDSFVVLITDDLGSTSTQTISLNLAAVNDLPVFGSGISGSATEDQILPVSGSLGISDVDAGESFLVARTGVAGSYGSFSIDSAGAWSYTLDNGKAAVQGLGAGQSTAESFLVSSFDGSASQAVTISIQGRNDLALISGTASASIQEEQASVSASLSISDPDSGESAFVPRSAVAGSYGSFSINAAGAWNFVLDNSKTAVQALASGSSVSESFLVSSLDGGSSQNVTVILQGVNDIPVISGTSSVEISEDDSSASGSLGIVDADSSESSFIAATASSSYGVLDFATDGSWSFTTAKAAQALNTGVSVSLSLTAISKDGSASSVLSVVLQGQSEPLAWLDLKEDLDLNLVPDLIDSGAVRRYSGPADSIAGESLASGDFNGDGVQDFLFGAYGVAPAGAAYLLDGQSAAGGSLSPGSLLISGDDAGDIAGATVRACGDFDGDGFGDFLVAAPAAAELYLIYGSASLSAVNLSVDGDADGLPDVLEAGAGLRIRGPASEGFGDALAAADLNGDGYSDLAIGVRLADSSTQVDCGKVVIVFGGATRPGAAIDLSVDLNADQIPDYLAAGGGLQIFGQGAYDDFGASLDGGGDVNGDGIEDLLVGAKGADRSGSNAGSAYLLYGRTGLWSSSLDLHADTNANSLPDAFDAGQGLRLDGASGQGLGSSVALLGDVNGDGYGDFALGAEAAGSGRAWVLHGGAALPVQIDLATDAGGNGLADWIELHGGAQIHGFAAGDYFGHALAAAGDVNGDGYADVLVAASGMDFSGRSDAGGVVLLFGGLTLDGRIELALDDGSLPSSNSADGRPDFLENGGGVLIAGAAAQDALEGLMLAAAGDIDGDGFDDFLAAFGNAGGGQGYSFLIRGQDFLNGLGGLLSGTSRSGSAAADIFVGSAVAETFSSIGSGDSVRCGAGDDILSLSASGFLHLDGGLGDDRLILNLASLDLSGISAGRLRSWEIFDLSYEGPQSVSLDVDALRHLEVDGGALRILRDVDDSVTLTGFTLGSSRNIDGQDYAIWTAAAAPSLEIQVLELI
ncbi:MAG: hypothetical protein RL095_2064, partial [Verrucomicrobiota bacterium]